MNEAKEAVALTREQYAKGRRLCNTGNDAAIAQWALGFMPAIRALLDEKERLEAMVAKNTGIIDDALTTSLGDARAHLAAQSAELERLRAEKRYTIPVIKEYMSRNWWASPLPEERWSIDVIATELEAQAGGTGT